MRHPLGVFGGWGWWRAMLPMPWHGWVGASWFHSGVLCLRRSSLLLFLLLFSFVGLIAGVQPGISELASLAPETIMSPRWVRLLPVLVAAGRSSVARKSNLSHLRKRGGIGQVPRRFVVSTQV